MEIEIWNDIKGYEGLYQASNLGRVKSLERTCNSKEGGRMVPENIRTLSIVKGRHSVTLHVKRKRKMYRVAQLVAMSFLNHVPCGLDEVIDHLDGNKLNDRLTNLEIVTQFENSRRGKGCVNKHLPKGIIADERYGGYILHPWCTKTKKSIHIKKYKTLEEATEAAINYYKNK